MKKVKKYLGILTLTAFLGVTSPVVAQSGDNTTTSSTSSSDDGRDDTGKWGLAGLLGLLGLLGLRKKDNDHRPTNTGSNR
ncbi:MAG TPA: WGxxGxxG family protein [Chitinophagaceae bacterium]|nr:WGxxGxxG family protein [Chitinophagaceae bacterium]